MALDLYFATEFEFWKLAADGTLTLLSRVNVDAFDNVPANERDKPHLAQGFRVIGDTIYFQAKTVNGGFEPWIIKPDGTIALAANIASGANDSSPIGFVAFN